jgi:hypothetical protein
MASSFSPRLFNPKIFIATILAVVMSSIGTYAQRASAPTHKRAETADIVDANGNRASGRPGPHSELNWGSKRPVNNSHRRCYLQILHFDSALAVRLG